MIVFFTFFYTSITFNTDETADNMKQYGGFIPGIRAGRATSEYLTYIINRLNTVGAVYLLFVALIPTVLILALSIGSKMPFGGTTILIIAGVGLDTLRQARAQTEQFQYEGFLDIEADKEAEQLKSEKTATAVLEETKTDNIEEDQAEESAVDADEQKED